MHNLIKDIKHLPIVLVDAFSFFRPYPVCPKKNINNKRLQRHIHTPCTASIPSIILDI